ncbi:MAG TPA: hypothetical protein VGI76_04525 [Solirubrobacteraceae bacterium]
MRPSLLLAPGVRRRDAQPVRRARRRRRERAANAAPTKAPEIEAPVTDAAAQRVREAGGPLDQATYTCGCGCIFAAAVTTSVACPHCGDAQAW